MSTLWSRLAGTPLPSSLHAKKKKTHFVCRGDTEEAVADGLQAALDMPYRANATKVCIFIADAPPHGMGNAGDGFPNVCVQR
jgi:hypothetical protein